MKDIPDQVVIAGSMTTEDAQLMLRILRFELIKAAGLNKFVGTPSSALGLMARDRLVAFVETALTRAGRQDIIDKAL